MITANVATYWYEGYCPQTGKLLRLPRTDLAEAIARQLMQQLATDEQYAREGKMYGVLLAATPTGETQVLKAFSGLLNGQNQVAGWVPPIPGREQVAFAETVTLAKLEAIKQELLALQDLPERSHHASLAQDFVNQWQTLTAQHAQRKQQRQHQRQHFYQTLTDADLAIALDQLDEQSRRDGIERRQFKQQRDAILQPLKQQIDQADARMQALKQQRKLLSRQLQAHMHATYSLTNFAGQSFSLQQLGIGGLPTGTGDCCAPKLLHYAATNHLKPLAMAEFWWGSNTGDKVQGEFYGACVERCQPLMGFLLSGLGQAVSLAESLLDTRLPVPILYEDEWLIAVNKPAGLLSVPGRYRDRQDSVLSRLRQSLPDSASLLPPHRLDQDTSGILLLAKDRPTYRHLSWQWQQRQVSKVYDAILAGNVAMVEGVIDLPLWGDPRDRPRQKVDWQRGKPSQTKFRVIAQKPDLTRVEFMPLTGRTHQLRVHAATGLGVPIWGDRLYSSDVNPSTKRLHLHARVLTLRHPQSGQMLHLEAETPF